MTQTHTPSLSILFPCDNDRGTIGALVSDAKRVGVQLTDDVEIIAIDNGSTDGTRDALLELKLRNEIPEFKLILHDRKLRYGELLKSGFEAASKDIVFYTDGDAQYTVSELPLLWEKLTREVDIVNGYKTKRHDPLQRIIVGWLYQHLTRLAFALPIRDVDCDFRLFRRRVLDAVSLQSNTGTITVELIKRSEQAEFRFAEAPVSHVYRTHGPSKFFSFQRIVRATVRLAALWFTLMVIGRRRESQRNTQS